MSRTVIFLEDLGPGEKGIAEMLAPVSIRRLTLCFSIVSKTQDPLLLWWSQEPGWEAPGPIIRWEVLALFPPGTRDSVLSNVFPDKWGPGGSFLWGHSLLKWPACPH
jgi:hypothetical protein